MRIEIICTGDEILTGKTINTNYGYMAQRLQEVGLGVRWGATVGDDQGDLLAAFLQAGARAEAVIVNGGLGPTVDDLSQEVAAQAAGVELELDEGWLARMEAHFRRRGREMPVNNRKQAMLPAGSEVLDNPIGTACGFALTLGGARFFFTPGVPREMRRMLDEQIIPRLLAAGGEGGVIRMKRFHSFGIGESRADHLLADLEALAPGGRVKLGFQSHYPELETKLVIRAPTAEEADRALAPIAALVRDRLGAFVLAEDEETLEGVLLDALTARGGTLATAESYTGGAIAARLGPTAGPQGPFRRGLVARDHGELAAAVDLDPADPISAAHLAQALRRRAGTSQALAVLVELDGEGADQAGTIDIGIATAAGEVARRVRLIGDRRWIRLGASELGLDCLRRHLLGLPVDQRIDFETR